MDETSKQKSRIGNSVDECTRLENLGTPKRGVFFYTEELPAEKGAGLFQKWHRSAVFPNTVDQSMSLSPAEVRSYRLIRCWTTGEIGMVCEVNEITGYMAMMDVGFAGRITIWVFSGQ